MTRFTLHICEQKPNNDGSLTKHYYTIENTRAVSKKDVDMMTIAIAKNGYYDATFMSQLGEMHFPSFASRLVLRVYNESKRLEEDGVDEQKLDRIMAQLDLLDPPLDEETYQDVHTALRKVILIKPEDECYLTEESDVEEEE